MHDETMLFLVTLLDPSNLRMIRKVVRNLEDYMDWLENAGILQCVIEVAHVDTELSDMFGLSTV